MDRLVARLAPVLRGTANKHPSFCFRALLSTQETTNAQVKHQKQGQADMEQQSHDCADHEKQQENQIHEDAEDQEYRNPATGEIGGPKGPEPTRFGDWEKGGRCYDF